MKRFLLACLIFPITLFGNDCCEMECCSPCSDWSFFGEWIYWRSRECDLDYAVPYSSGVSTGRIQGIEPGCASGFRVGVGKGCANLDFVLAYTYYHPTESSHASGNLGLTHVSSAYAVTGFAPGSNVSAGAKWDLDYDAVEFITGVHINLFDCMRTRVYGGLKFAYMDRKFTIDYRSFDQAANRAQTILTTDMDAYGLTMGGEGLLPICDAFSLFGDLSYDVFAANFKRKHVFKNSTDSGVSFSEAVHLKDQCWRLVSVINLALGIKFHFPRCFCVDWDVSFGYEFHQWMNLSDFIFVEAPANNVFLDRHQLGLGIDGLFLRLTGSF